MLDRPPTIPTRFLLPNGLTLLVDRSANKEVMAAALCLPVGGATETEDTEGLSHFLEHAFDLGSARYPAGEMAERLASWGGLKNASTGKDATCYYAALPPRYLREYLSFEADRFFDLRLPEGEVEKEIRVIIEERRSRVQDRIQGDLLETTLACLYGRHAYGLTLIGREERLRGYTRDSVLAYYKRHYLPRSAVLCLSSSLDPQAIHEAVLEHFNRERPGMPAPWPAPPEPLATSVTVETLPHGELSTALLAWLGPTKDDDDRVYLDLFAAIEATGHSSRLHRALVKRDRIAISARATTGRHRLGGYFLAQAVGQRGVSADELLDALSQEMALARDEPLEPGEVASAVERWKLARASLWQSAVERVQLLAKTEVTDPRGVAALDRDLEVLDQDLDVLCEKVRAAVRRGRGEGGHQVERPREPCRATAARAHGRKCPFSPDSQPHESRGRPHDPSSWPPRAAHFRGPDSASGITAPRP